MISNSNSEVDKPIKENTFQSTNLSNSSFSGDENKNYPPMNNSISYNTNTEEKKEEKKEDGIFEIFFNFFKNPQKIEEEEAIDAHGFKCKRPKNKIPLRKKRDTYEDDIQRAGGNSFSYASQNSGFGKLFL